jgi:hypothetical protein
VWLGYDRDYGQLPLPPTCSAVGSFFALMRLNGATDGVNLLPEPLGDFFNAPPLTLNALQLVGQPSDAFKSLRQFRSVGVLLHRNAPCKLHVQ